MPEIDIRVANTSDATSIALLGNATFKETFGHLFHDREDLRIYLEQTFSMEKITKSLAKSNNIYWLALADQIPVGYAKLKINSPSDYIPADRVAQLQKIYILKQYHALKIGRQLQDNLLSRTKKEGYSKIWLSVLATNHKAIAFYRRSGFKAIGEHDFSIGKEHFHFLVLALNL